MSSGLNASMKTSAPLVNGVVNNMVLLQATHQSDAASNHFILHFCLVDSLLNYARIVLSTGMRSCLYA